MSSADAARRTVADVTCLGCGCLCDDIAVAVEADRVVAIDRDCDRGREWFLARHPGEGAGAARIDGRPAPLAEALDRAAAILAGARAPVVWGLTDSSIEAVGVALALADRLGATVDLAGSARRAGHRAAFIRSGSVSATLGEVRDRAEVVLFWGGHPGATHPRHAERYSIQPPGRFVGGRRAILVVDLAGATLPAAAVDRRIALAPDRQEAALGVILALVGGRVVDPARVRAATGVDLESWRDLADRLLAGRWDAVFFGPAAEGLGATGWDRPLALVRALNRDGRRAVGLTLGEPGNVAGAGAVLCWQGGAPACLDFGPGWPDHRPGEATLADRLSRGAVDAVLAVGTDPGVELPRELIPRLAGVPLVRIAPDATGADAGGPIPTVGIAVGRLGIEAGGTVARVDGLMLPLRPPLVHPDRVTDHTILSALLDRLA